jgi:hypothetical protein
LVERSSSSRISRHTGFDLGGAVAGPEGQGRPIDRNALTRQDLGLAVKRAVVGIFRDDDMGYQLLGRQAALDQPRRRLHHRPLASDRRISAGASRSLGIVPG